MHQEISQKVSTKPCGKCYSRRSTEISLDSHKDNILLDDNDLSQNFIDRAIERWRLGLTFVVHCGATAIVEHSNSVILRLKFI